MIFSKAPMRLWPSVAVGSAAALAGMAVVENARARRAEAAHPPIGDFLSVDGVRLHYIQRGSGPDVVLLHGNGAMIQDFAISTVLDRLTERYRVTVFDRPGFGYSERPRGRLWGPQAQAALLSRAFPQLGIERPVVVGHSWGAMVAAALGLLQVPRGLLLMSGYYFPTARADVPFFAPPAIPVVGDVLRYTVSPAVGRAIAPKVFARIFEPRPVPERFAAEFPLDLCLRPWQLRAIAEDTALMIPAAAAMESRYGELAMPTAIIVGADDRIVDMGRHSERLYGEMQAAELHIVPETGHMVHYAVPDEVVQAIDRVSRG